MEKERQLSVMPKKISTTVNLKTIDRNRIKELSSSMGKTTSEITVILLRIVLSHYTRFLAEERSVQYQERDATTQWKPLFVRMDYWDYESFLDLRKFCKKTVSLLVSLAISHFLKELLSDKNSELVLQSNKVLHYCITRKELKNAISWKIYWGLPLKL